MRLSTALCGALLVCACALPLGGAQQPLASFEKCLGAGADFMAASFKTSIRFVDPWHQQSWDSQYPYWTTATVTEGPLFNIQKTDQDGSLYSITVNNTECSTSVLVPLSRTQQYSNSITLSLTASLQVSESLELSASIGNFGIKDTTTVTCGLSSTAATTSTSTSTFSIAETITVPNSTYEQINWLVSSVTFSGMFTFSAVFNGWVPIWFNNKVNLDGSGLHWLWFIPPENVVQWGIQAGFGNNYCSGFCDPNTADNCNIFSSTAQVSGNYGFDATLQLDPQKIPCVDPYGVVDGPTSSGGRRNTQTIKTPRATVTPCCRLDKVNTQAGRLPLPKRPRRIYPATLQLENAIRKKFSLATLTLENIVEGMAVNDSITKATIARGLSVQCQGELWLKLSYAVKLAKKLKKSQPVLKNLNVLAKAAGCKARFT